MGNSNSAPFHGRSKATPHKRRDPSLPPLFGTDARIVIIGGGPAGVHMGHLLKKHGFTNVTILEQADEIGGKSKSLFHAPAGEDVPHEMGTCFMHPGYHRIFALADEYDNGPYFKTGGDNYDKCNIFSPELNKKKGFPEDKPQFILDWMFSDVEESKVPPACFCLPDKIQMLSVYDAIKRYGIIHRSIFGEFDYTLPPRPDDKTLKKITITFGEFLEQHKLQALIPIIILGTSAQGYGLIETLPAFYGLWWNTPELLESLILKKPLTRMFQKGFQNLWKTIAEKDQLNVILNAGVTSIDRSLDDPLTPVRVETTVSGQARTFEADFLIVTSPLKAALGLFKDPTKEEKEIFGALKPASLITTLYKSDVLNQGERATTYYPERLNVAQQGRFYAERNSSRAVWPEREQDPVTRYSVAYQYFDEYQEGREEKCEKEMRQGLEEAGYKNIELIKQLAWEYFPKFSAEHIIKHYPWKLLEMQGTKRTWYAGSSACFESVEDVVSYNHLLLQVFNIEKDPNADKETGLPQKEVGMALLPFFLPKVPRETQEVYFTKDYSITGKCDEADELLRLLTHSRRQTNTVLLKFPVSDVNTDAGILVSEYFSLLLGLNEDPSPEAHAAPPQEAATPAGASTGESQTPEGRPEEGAAEEKPMEIPAPAAKSLAPTGPPAPSPPSPAEGAKIPLSRGVAYSWTNFSRKAKSRGYGAIEFEVNSTLINLGVWYLQLAKELLSCKDKSQKDKAQKEAFRYCNVAAGVFQFVVDKSAEEEGDLSDVRPNVSRALKEISLAEAQTITISRAETANHSANLLASLCRDSSLKYSAAKETLLSPNPTPSPDVEDNLLHYLEAKRELFLAKAHYHHSFHFTQPEAPSPGLSVRCMQDAVEHIKLAQEHYGRFLALAPDARAEEGSSTIAGMLSEYERRHSKLAKENDSAFFEKVPEEPVPLPEPRCNSEPVPYVFPPVDKSRWTEAVYASIKANRDAMAEVAKPSAAASCCSVM